MTIDVYGLVNSHSLSFISHLKFLFGSLPDISNSSEKDINDNMLIERKSPNKMKNKSLRNFLFSNENRPKPGGKIV